MDIKDYDSGLLNDYGGGNVDWWFDYMRAEISRCNDYWREHLEQIEAQQKDSADSSCRHGHVSIKHGFCDVCGEQVE